jgi:hypothetical protein
MKTALKFSLQSPQSMVGHVLPIIPFETATLKLAKKVNGLAGNDGIDDFQEAIVKAAALPKVEGRKLLFADGLGQGQVNITGWQKINNLSGRRLAAPDLVWSLCKEHGLETLNYLYYTYDVISMEALLRIFRGTGNHRYSLVIFRERSGSWQWELKCMNAGRYAIHPALVLG